MAGEGVISLALVLKRVGGLAGVALAMVLSLLVGVQQAHAQLEVPELSTADLYTIASAVIVVAAAVYVIRRGLGLLR